jgi:hypothetical protein
MPQGVLPFQYQAEPTGRGLTALGGLGLHLDFLYGIRLPHAADQAIGLRKQQGYRDGQMVVALTLLNLAGGEAVQALDTLEHDEGLMTLLRHVERHGPSAPAPATGVGRFRRERERTLPSASSVFRYLEALGGKEEIPRVAGQAVIPPPSPGLVGLRQVNTHLVGEVQRLRPHQMATLDMDATLVETGKAEALVSYKGTKAYQPLQTYWVEQDLLLHTEFRDGNVPAGHEQLRVFQESLALLPAGVEEARLRSDTAGYQVELLRYCAEGKDPRFGVIPFAVGADMTQELQGAVRAVEEKAWQPLGGEQEWAEVNFVPNWIGHKKSSPEYRYLAVREPVRQAVLPGLEGQLSFPALTLGQGRLYKVTALVTNRTLAGPEIFGWYRERCGKSEEVHRILKEELAGGTLPSGSFGENAAWWAIAALAFNAHTAVKGLALGGSWVSKRLKTVRFHLLNVPGRVVAHGRRLLVRLGQAHPAFAPLVAGRQRLRALLAAPA